MEIDQEQWNNMHTYSFYKDFCHMTALTMEIQEKMNLDLLPTARQGERPVDGAVDYLDGIFTVKLFEELSQEQQKKLNRIVNAWKD